MTTEQEIVTGNLLIRRVVVGDLTTNCWVVASSQSKRAFIIDPGDNADQITEATDGLSVAGVLLTHTHWDHVLAVPEIENHFGTTSFAHVDDQPVWPDEVSHLQEHGHFDAGTATAELLDCGCSLGPANGSNEWDGKTRPITNGTVLPIDQDQALRVLHTPGHTPGGISFAVGGHVFTGDTLFPGGPGLTGWPHSDFTTIIESISACLFTLPEETQVHPGHGSSTIIGAERPSLPSWVKRGW